MAFRCANKGNAGDNCDITTAIDYRLYDFVHQFHTRSRTNPCTLCGPIRAGHSHGYVLSDLHNQLDVVRFVHEQLQSDAAGDEVAIGPLPADLDPSATSSSLGLHLVEGMTGELGGILPVRLHARQPQFILYGLFYELVYRQVLSFRFYCKLSVQLRPQPKIEPSRVWLLRGDSLSFTPRDVVIH
jgi:hypothetical protein